MWACRRVGSHDALAIRCVRAVGGGRAGGWLIYPSVPRHGAVSEVGNPFTDPIRPGRALDWTGLVDSGTRVGGQAKTRRDRIYGVGTSCLSRRWNLDAQTNSVGVYLSTLRCADTPNTSRIYRKPLSFFSYSIRHAKSKR